MIIGLYKYSIDTNFGKKTWHNPLQEQNLKSGALES